MQPEEPFSARKWWGFVYIPLISEFKTARNRKRDGRD
jgi:hypothetical protein